MGSHLNTLSLSMAVPTHIFNSPATPSHGILEKINHVSVHSQDYKVLYQQKFEEVRQFVGNSVTGDSVICLMIIDSLQNLGIDYHFQDEIQFALSNHYNSGDLCLSLLPGSKAADNGFRNVLLFFRLLRRNGYHVSTDVLWRSFCNHDKLDLEEMLDLYQASQFIVDGEDLLEQINTFNSKKLHECLPQLNEYQANLVHHTLDCPYDKTLTRFNLRNYIKCRPKIQREYEILLQEFAEMDLNLVEYLYRQELQQITLWWNELGLAQKLTFARDQPIKWYVWSMATLDDPMLSEQRIQLTKPIAFVYLMDDIFDVYGNLEELVLFAEAINKWEVNAIKQLPYPMQTFLKELYTLTEEISHEIHHKHGWNPIESIKGAWKLLSNAFLVEARWFASGNLPGSKEYLQNGVISTGVHVVFVHIFFLLGQGINQETVNLIDDIPGLIANVAKILRLWDDLGSAKDENQQGYDGSFIECYMKEHGNSTIDNARTHVTNMIAITWKQLNKEYLSPSPFSLSFKKASLNAAKMVCLMYIYDANQRLPSLEKHIKTLLSNNISLPK